jgi:alkylation response protein AidB-like acyl-CoA dehydrogenase
MVQELYAVNASVTLTLIGTVRTTATLRGDQWIIEGRKSWVSSATGWDRKGADVLSVLCRTDPDAPAERGISIIVVERPASGLVFERAIDSVGHRAHLLPQFNLNGVGVPRDSILGSLGGGLALTAACFTGAAALVGVFAVALMRTAFEFTLGFARNERRGGVHPIIEHPAVGYALADAKMAIQATPRRHDHDKSCRPADERRPGRVGLSHKRRAKRRNEIACDRVRQDRDSHQRRITGNHQDADAPD